MSECRCPGCSRKPGPTFTEAFRFECEVRYLAHMPTRDHRKGYLRHVALKRGGEASARLIDGLRRLHRERRAA